MIRRNLTQGARAALLGAALFGLIAISNGLLAGTPGVQADGEAVVSDATLVWKVSGQAWTSSSLAPGHATTGSAYKDADNGFVFPNGEGSYNPDTGETTIDFTGSLQIGNFGQGNYRLRLANPSIIIGTNGVGRLEADVSYCAPPTDCGDPVNTSTPWTSWTPSAAATRVVVVNFDTDNGTITDSGTDYSLTVTPDFPLQPEPPAVAGGHQFPQSFLNAMTGALIGHFRETNAGQVTSGVKAPSPIGLTFDYEEESASSSASQTITTEVVAYEGGLTLSVENAEVELPTPVFNGSTLASEGTLNPVTVTDLRLGNPGWNVNGQVSDFVSGSDSFGGEHLGWDPEVIDSSDGQTVTEGATVAPGTGLASPQTLGSAASGAGFGTAVLGADLSLEVPVTTPEGEYSATLTLTVI